MQDLTCASLFLFSCLLLVPKDFQMVQTHISGTEHSFLCVVEHPHIQVPHVMFGQVASPQMNKVLHSISGLPSSV